MAPLSTTSIIFIVLLHLVTSEDASNSVADEVSAIISSELLKAVNERDASITDQSEAIKQVVENTFTGALDRIGKVLEEKQIEPVSLTGLEDEIVEKTGQKTETALSGEVAPRSILDWVGGVMNGAKDLAKGIVQYIGDVGAKGYEGAKKVKGMMGEAVLLIVKNIETTMKNMGK